MELTCIKAECRPNRLNSILLLSPLTMEPIASGPTVLRPLFAAPHRPLFTLGLVQILLVMVVWGVELAGRLQLIPAPMLGPLPLFVHTFLMIYGVFPFFIFGFLFTVYPRWMNTAPVERGSTVATSVLLGSGYLLLYPGLYGPSGILMTAVVLILAGWASALWTLLRVFLSASRRGQHERLLNVALTAGLIGVLTFLVAVATGHAKWYALSREIGLWLFLVPVVFMVAHRMIPFFSQSVLMNYLMVRPVWAPPLMVACVIGHVALDLAGLGQWRFVADLPLAVAALHLSWVWQFRRSFHARLLAMLHIAFLWLGIAMLLYTLQSIVLLIAGNDVLGRAPLHALGIGFLTSMIVAMASRVMLGHSGRMLSADNLTWAVLAAVNVTAVLRIAGEWWPVAGAWLNLAAALVWLISLAPWVIHYLPMTTRPRVDGRPG
jgi:uncharacterized protein involved in response to NO